MAIERILPGSIEWDAFYANHILRYQFAADIIDQTTVNCLLDAACGVGYGSAYLAKQPGIKKIVAIDRSQEALKVANTHFKDSKISYLQDDCHTLAAASKHGMYDVIVSFETLEHLPEPMDFLRSCFNYLNPEGKIVISTPNKSVSSPEQLNWEYHETEYTAKEFYQLLQTTGFKNIKLYGQQLNLKGKIKTEIRGDLNRLFSNPFIRTGIWLQSKLKGYKQQPILKETIDDFEFVAFDNPTDCDLMGNEGPFVLLAVAVK